MPLADVNESYTDIVDDGLLVDDRREGVVRDRSRRARVVQVLTAARMWGRLGLPAACRAGVATVHRWSGRLAFLFTLPVFFHCVTILGFETPDTRVAVHSVAGSFVYGVFAAKVLIVRDRSLPGWVLPAAGLHAGVDARARSG